MTETIDQFIARCRAYVAESNLHSDVLPTALAHIEALQAERNALKARVAELEAVLGDARQWIGARNTHGGHIAEALLSRLDRLAMANGGKG